MSKCLATNFLNFCILVIIIIIIIIIMLYNCLVFNTKEHF